MEKLYYQYPYVKEFDAVVLSCEKGRQYYETELDRTAFYPEGGGQPADGGTLSGIPVLDVRERDGRILHMTKQPFTPGEQVHGTIDWEKRFSLTQEHSGEHIVSGLIYRKYGYHNVGYHMGEEIRLDLDGVLTWEELMEIEKAANEIVYSNVPLRIWYPDAEELARMDYRSKKELTGEVRLVEIPGADICACCGTHVEYTGEIGAVKFLSMIHYKGGVRIMMHAGARAMEDYRKKTDANREICELLSAKPYEAARAVRRLLEEEKQKDIRISALTRELFRLKAEALPDHAALLIDFTEGLSPLELRKYCDFLMKQEKGVICAVFSGTGEEEREAYSFCIGSSTLDLRAACKELCARLSGRGGGSAQMVQGTFFAGEAEIRNASGSVLYGLIPDPAPGPAAKEDGLH